MILAQAKLQQALGYGTREFLPQLSGDLLPFDVEIACLDGKAGAHSFVLRARSTYFRKLFSGLESTGEMVALPLVTVAVQSVEEVLRFLYSVRLD